MRIAVTYGPMCLQRSAEETWDDPRTGSEVGWRRIVEELRLLGHIATIHIGGDGSKIADYDVAVSINEPDSLRGVDAKLRICEFWLNRFEFCQPGYDEHVDLYTSPSQAHLDQVLGAWGAQKPEKWRVNPLGCDLADYYPGIRKVPGRVVHCSSPDRALHRLVEAWPSIKRAIPHATLRIFYRLEEWMRAFDTTPYFPSIERNRQRALYIAEALKRLSGPEWGVEVRDSVDRTTLAKELSEAEVFAFPCETMSWSEGFSCSTLEACAAEACPVLTDCDALGDVYRDLDPVPVGNWTQWRDDVVRALTDPAFRAQRNKKARALAEKLTWKAHAQRLDGIIRGSIKH
jgi:glycosyltransferase involved in cell wall biosynthesis